MNKAPVISGMGWMEAQRDADHKHYQGIIREIFEEIEKWEGAKYLTPDSHWILPFYINKTAWQSLKSKY